MQRLNLNHGSRFSGIRSHMKLFLLFWLFWWNTSELLFGLSWTLPFVICQRGPWAMGIRVANFQDELQEHGIPCLLDLPAVGRLAFLVKPVKSGWLLWGNCEVFPAFLCVFFFTGAWWWFWAISYLYIDCNVYIYMIWALYLSLSLPLYIYIIYYIQYYIYIYIYVYIYMGHHQCI